MRVSDDPQMGGPDWRTYIPKVYGVAVEEIKKINTCIKDLEKGAHLLEVERALLYELLETIKLTDETGDPSFVATGFEKLRQFNEKRSRGK